MLFSYPIFTLVQKLMWVACSFHIDPVYSIVTQQYSLVTYWLSTNEEITDGLKWENVKDCATSGSGVVAMVESVSTLNHSTLWGSSEILLLPPALKWKGVRWMHDFHSINH